MIVMEIRRLERKKIMAMVISVMKRMPANGNDKYGGEEWEEAEKKEDRKTYKKRRG